MVPPVQRRFLAKTVAFFSSLAVIAVSLSACSGQGEGQRCDTRDDSSGTSDCASGLVCDTSAPGIASYSSTSTPAGSAGFGLCCPPQGGKPPTTAACGAGATLRDAGFPDAGGDATTNGTDAASDGASSSEAGSSSSEAGPSDGGLVEASTVDSAASDGAADAANSD